MMLEKITFTRYHLERRTKKDYKVRGTLLCPMNGAKHTSFNITSSYLGSLPFGRTGRQDHPVLKWTMSVLPN